MKVRKSIARILNLATAVVALLIIAALAARWNGSALSGPLRPGDTLDLVGLEKGRSALVLALMVECTVCDQSAETLKLLAQRAADSGRLVVAVFPNSPQNVAEYLAETPLHPTAATSLDLEKVGIPKVPAVIFVDADGKVEAAWYGPLEAAQRERALELAGQLH